MLRMLCVLLKVPYIFPHKGTLLKKSHIRHRSEFKNEKKSQMPRKNNLKGQALRGRRAVKTKFPGMWSNVWKMPLILPKLEELMA